MATVHDIKTLCRNPDDLSESELVSTLRATEIDPNELSERDFQGETLLHIAAMHGRSPEFCRVLHDQNSTLVKTTDNYGWLPVHCACNHPVKKLEIANYLFNVYPESIHIPTANRGEYPIHLLAGNNYGEGSNDLQLLTFLLKHDNGAVSTPNNYGELPLHCACWGRGLAFVKLLFDAYPDGVFVHNEGRTPLDYARLNNQADVVHFVETQLRFHRQSQEDQDSDINGQLPLHRVLQSENVSLGTIKLMVGVHRASVAVADNRGCIPLHYACRFGDLNIVKYLVGLTEESPTVALDTVDSERNLPLHYACLAGKLDVVNYILDISPRGVFKPNKNKKLPIDLLLFDAVCDRDLQYVNTIDSLIRANPVESLKVLLESNQSES
eukprot:scaffold17853_cov65-Cyclotella_meneghiniana.AAC.8